MSEIDEPPAKVLKIDNINGVTHVTEMSSLPEDFHGSMDEEILGEESGIIEGGADLEQGEGQEEWLSEGILTDDDYNPASQETVERTDSQIGTSQDEEDPNDSTEQLDTTAESEANIAENEANIENDANIADSEANITENVANIGENEANAAEDEANTLDSEANEANIDSEVNETNIMDSETNVADGEENLMEMGDIGETNAMESQTYTQPCDLETIESENKTKVSKYVANTKNEANVSKNGANVPKIGSNVLKSKPNFPTNEAIVPKSEANVSKKEEFHEKNVSSDIANVSQENGHSIKQEKDSKNWNIEETMEHLDGNKDADVKHDLFDSLLIRKKDVKSEKKVKMEEKQSDGNDTDDLLRMLGDDDTKTKKKMTKTVADIRAAAKSGNVSSDDDDFVYEGASKKLKAAKSALSKKQPTKAVPEDMEDGDDENDASADEASLMKYTYVQRAKHTASGKSKQIYTPKSAVRTPGSIVNIVERPAATEGKTLLRQYHNKRLVDQRSVVRPTPPKHANVGKTPTYQDVKRETTPKTATIKRPAILTPAPFRPSAVHTVPLAVGRKPERPTPDDEIDEEDFLDDDEFDINEDEFGESNLHLSKYRQLLRCPEMMDEEVPSDADTHSEEGSLYDELPSSESEDIDDWFTLDIRAEKAADYLPLLGSKAKEMLLDEKRGVTERLKTLRKNHAALCESGKKQAEQLREATLALAELDDMLKTA